MKGFRHFLRRVAPIALVAGAMLAAAVGAVAAQQSGTQPKATRRVIIRQDTNETMRVTVVLDGLDSLLRSLAQSRALEERIGIALRDYAGAPASEARKRALEEQLQKISRSNLQIMSKIQMACTSQQAHAHDPEGYLGVAFGIKGDVMRENNGPEVYHFDEPPEIISVESGSPADRAGVRAGDRMIGIDRHDVVGRDVVFANLLVPGRRLPMRVDRDGHEQDVVVVIQKRPDEFGDQCADLDLSMLPMRTPGFAQVAPVPGTRGMIFSRTPAPPRAADAPEAPGAPSIPIWTFEMPPPVAIAGFSSLVAGAQLTTLTEDFKDLTGAAAGLLVQRVAPESPAALAGLKGGDVIVEAGGRQVTSARLLQRLISDTDARSLKLKVVRKGKARTAWLKW